MAAAASGEVKRTRKLFRTGSIAALLQAGLGATPPPRALTGVGLCAAAAVLSTELMVWLHPSSYMLFVFLLFVYLVESLITLMSGYQAKLQVQGKKEEFA